MANNFNHSLPEGTAQALSLQGQRVLITGAAGGIGSATARVCAALGAELILVDLLAPQVLADELQAQGGKATAVVLDVANRVATEALIAQIGIPDAVVLNAGWCPWDDWLESDWDQRFDAVIDINLRSVVHMMRAVLPGMVERGRGRVVLVSSMAGRMGGLKASPHYVAAKGGVGALVKWFARRGAPHGVNVNAVAPGATQSAMTQDQQFDATGIPVGRMAKPTEIALPIAFLCSPAASYICGTTLDVNGGVFMN